jgi:hypothetical protein
VIKGAEKVILIKIVEESQLCAKRRNCYRKCIGYLDKVQSTEIFVENILLKKVSGATHRNISRLQIYGS